MQISSAPRRYFSSLATALTCAAVAAIAGCGSKGVVGKWTGTIPMPGGSPMPMSAEFKSDGTETQTGTIMGHMVVVNSTYTIKDNTLSESIAGVTLDGKTMPSMPAKGRSESFVYKVDGDTLTLTSGTKPPVVLKRSDK